MKKEATLTDLHELLMHVVEHMATREETATKAELADGLASVRGEMAEGFSAIREEMATKTEMSAGFASIRSQISEVKQQMKDLEEVVQDQAGFANEIDHVLERTAVIERHLGLQTS